MCGGPRDCGDWCPECIDSSYDLSFNPKRGLSSLTYKNLFWMAAVIISFLLIGIVSRAAGVGQIDELPISLNLTRMDTFDFSGTEFYQLKRGALVLVVSTDPHNDAANWLRKHAGEKVTVVLSGKD